MTSSPAPPGFAEGLSLAEIEQAPDQPLEMVEADLVCFTGPRTRSVFLDPFQNSLRIDQRFLGISSRDLMGQTGNFGIVYRVRTDTCM